MLLNYHLFALDSLSVRRVSESHSQWHGISHPKGRDVLLGKGSEDYTLEGPLGERLRGDKGARKGPLTVEAGFADLLVRALSCHAESVSDVLPGHSHILRRLAGVAFDRIQAL